MEVFNSVKSQLPTIRWAIQWAIVLLPAMIIAQLIIGGVTESSRYSDLEHRVTANTEFLINGQKDRFTGTQARLMWSTLDARLIKQEERIRKLESSVGHHE